MTLTVYFKLLLSYNYIYQNITGQVKYTFEKLLIKSVTCDRSVVFSGYSGFLHQEN
jgi:hypothetical protein